MIRKPTTDCTDKKTVCGGGKMEAEIQSDADNPAHHRSDNEQQIGKVENAGTSVQRNDSNLSSYSKATVTNRTVNLEFVLPNQLVFDDPQGFDSISGIHRRSRPPSRAGSIIESKSPGFVNTRLVNYNRGLSHQPSIVSHRPHHDEHAHLPPPTSEEEKSKTTRRVFATVFAISYAIFLVIFGLIAFIGHTVETPKVDIYPVPQIFSIYMLCVAMSYFIFLYIDIRMHIKKAKSAVKEREEQIQQYQTQIAYVEENLQSSLEFRRSSNGNLNVQIPLPDVFMNPLKSISHRYCFATGRHGEFMYLKFGAAWFCFGLLIHSILNLSYQITYMSLEPECRDPWQLTVDILFPLYSLFVLFFIFKYMNVIINSYRGIARFMLMHAIGTTLAFWIFTIVRETADAIRAKPPKETFIGSSFDLNATETIDCPDPDTDLNTIRRIISPYLYPFVIEFCILIVGIYYLMWANINKCPKKTSVSEHHHDAHHNDPHHNQQHSNKNHNSVSKVPSFNALPPIPERGVVASRSHTALSEISEHCNTVVEHDEQYKSDLVIYADCHASSRGLFAGFALLILKIVFIILLHIGANNPEYLETGAFIDGIFELTVLVIMIITTVVAYVQTSKLDVNPHPISKLDDVLLFIAIPAFFSETIFSMLPAIVHNGPNILNILIIMAQLIQILIQTPWICDALRRCSNDPELKKTKPGRELVIFMTIANVALWVYYTFSVKGVKEIDDRYDFYGDRLWSILNHLSLPLIMFYRFHASVCLVDVWRHSYEPAEAHH